MPARISIIIITYNRPADLLELLQNLAIQEEYSEVIEEVLILNNASTDNYTEITTFIENHPELKMRYIWSDENLGVARGRNKLMGIATGELLLSLDDDMVFTTPDDIGRLAGLFSDPYFKDANTGIITFRVLYYETREVQVTALPHKKFGKYGQMPRFLSAYFAGGAHIMKREVLAKTGIYPDDFHYGMEEYDLSYRVIDAGYSLGYDNSVTVLHKESPLGRQPTWQKLQMQWVNKSKVAWRYLPLKYFITTAASWALQYIRTAKGHWGGFFSGLAKVVAIPFSERRKKISKAALAYLYRVEARLKY